MNKILPIITIGTIIVFALTVYVLLRNNLPTDSSKCVYYSSESAPGFPVPCPEVFPEGVKENQ